MISRDRRIADAVAGSVLKPRWALNGYTLGGFGGIAGGVVSIGIPLLIDDVPQEVGWLPLMGAGMLVASVAFVGFMGRWGRLKDSSRAAREGVPGHAVIVAVYRTSAGSTSDSTGPTHRVVRLDLDVQAPGVAPYRLRTYRDLRDRQLRVATVGRRLDVRALPDEPRLIAIEWPEPAPATTLTITRQGPGVSLVGAGPMLVIGRNAAWSAPIVEPRMASARINSVHDIPSHQSQWPMAEYDLTVSIPGYAPYAVRIVDRGPATDGLAGTDVPVTVGNDPRQVAIVWGPAA